MAKSEETNPSPHIVIIKKKAKRPKHQSHQVWKIAYADFVTAMMAFFLLMWITSSVDEKTLVGVSAYFHPTETTVKHVRQGIGKLFQGLDPSKRFGSMPSASSPLNLLPSVQSPPMSRQQNPVGEKNPRPVPPSGRPGKEQHINDHTRREKVYEAVRESVSLSHITPPVNNALSFKRVPQGVEIQLIARKNYPLFEPHSARLTPHAERTLAVVGSILAVIPNTIIMMNYPGPSSSSSPTSWLLSVEQATTAKAWLESNGLSTKQVAQVIGRASSQEKDSKGQHLSIIIKS